MLIAGKSLKEIAAVSNVTVQTVWRHRVSILEKMGVQNDVELVAQPCKGPTNNDRNRPLRKPTVKY